MAIIKRYKEPNGLRDWRREIEDIFDDVFSLSGWRNDESNMLTAWSPRADISETSNEYMVSLELPGLEKKDIKVSMQDNRLTITGERKEAKTDKEKDYIRRERMEGSFYRSFLLPNAVNESDIAATFKNGVLKVTIPKVEEKKPKVVNVE